MISATLIALVTAATPAPVQPRALLKAPAATAPACRTSPAGDQLVQAPLFAPESAQCPVAKVADELIPLRELAAALEQGHMAHRPKSTGAQQRPDMDFTPALDRLVTTRLVVLEAREMNLDETPDFKAAVDSYRAARLRTMLQESVTKSLKPDPAEVRKIYADAVREWKITSVLLEKEEDAKAFEAALKAGATFDATTKKFVAEKKAKGGEKSDWVSPKHARPEIRAVASTAKPKVPVGPVRVEGGWVMFRVDATRVPQNDKAARAEAEAASLARKQHDAVRAFYQSLVAKYAKVDSALVKQIDLEAGGEKGFEALLKDPRPLATIQGEAPITVGDLTKEVSTKFFHGLASPIAEHRVNREKDAAFERLVGSRVFAKEAAVRKLASRPEYKRDVADYERGLAFNTFVEKVISPGVQVTEGEAMGYYEQHLASYTAPEMLRLDGFAFQTAKEAQGAIEKLKTGTDFAWLRQNAPGQLPPEQRTLQLDGGIVSANTVPPDLMKAISGAKSGDYRVYAAGKSEVYVIRVAERVPPAAQPYPEAREKIAKKLYVEKMASALKDYAARLRKAQPVDVYITRISL
jgi:parvulin-like peptidyl-prolyl isomerase